MQQVDIRSVIATDRHKLSCASQKVHPFILGCQLKVSGQSDTYLQGMREASPFTADPSHTAVNGGGGPCSTGRCQLLSYTNGFELLG